MRGGGPPMMLTSPAIVDLSMEIDVLASLQSLVANEHVQGGMLKLPADLERYRRVIADTRPEVIVEMGTATGASARWFRDLGPEVITVDLSQDKESESGITYVRGNSANQIVWEQVIDLVAGRRCMVSLDSDHSTAHATKE